MQRVTYCLECGIPLVKIEDFGGADPENRYCCNCTDEDEGFRKLSQFLKAFQEVFRAC